MSKSSSAKPPATLAPQIGLLLLALTLLLAASRPLPAQETAEPPKPPTQAQRAAALKANEGGAALFVKGEAEKALPSFQRAVKLDPRQPIYARNLAKCYAHIAAGAFRARRFADAARDFKLADDTDPSVAAYPRSRGRALIEGGQPRDAIPVLEETTRRFPNDVGAWRFLGRAFDLASQLAEAVRAFERALVLVPADQATRQALLKAKRELAAEGSLETSFGARHFTLKFDGRSDAELGRLVAPMLDQAYDEIGRAFGVYPAVEIAAVIYPGKSFRKVTGAHAWVTGLYDGKIRLPGEGLMKVPTAELRRILRHEYTHALVVSLAGRRCPVWLHEGLAQLVDGSPLARSRALLRASGRPKLAALRSPFSKVKEVAEVQRRYAAAHSFVSWLGARRGGAVAFVRPLKELGRGAKLDRVLKRDFGADLATLYEEWTALP